VAAASGAGSATVGAVGEMRIPALGPRGEGWVVAQLALGALIVSVGIAGPEWSSTAKTALLVAGIGIGIAGLALLTTGVVALGSSLTPFPKPSVHSTLRSGGAYRLVRHPIYGGLLLLAIGWSVLLSPIALVVTALLAVVLELKASGTKTGSWRPHVFVDEPTEEISPFDVGHALGLFEGGEDLGHLQLQWIPRCHPQMSYGSGMARQC